MCSACRHAAGETRVGLCEAPVLWFTELVMAQDSRLSRTHHLTRVSFHHSPHPVPPCRRAWLTWSAS